MKYLQAFLVLVLYVMLLGTNIFGQDQEIPSADSFLQNHGLKAGTELPAFKYKSIDDQTIDLSEYKGQFILIDFWGSWCKPCINEAPYLKEAHAKFGDKIKFVGVAVDDKEEKIREFNNRFGIDWVQVMTSSDSDLIKEFNVKLFPTKMLIGPDQSVLNGANSELQIGNLKGEKLIKTLNNYVNQDIGQKNVHE